MIDTLIFTKNRALQLELLLRSISDNFGEIKSANILCKTTEDRYIQAYAELKQKYEEHMWEVELDIQKQTRDIINRFYEEFCLILVDDEIVVNNQSIFQLTDYLKNHDEIHCASLRLGNNIGSYCYTANLTYPKPELDLIETRGIYKWDWTKGDQRVDWYYPSCINSHIYRTSFLKKWVNEIDFNNVNDLEGILNQNRYSFKPNMICLEKSKTINIANNLVQTGYNRHSSNQEYSPEELNKKFLEGYIIDSSDFYDINNDVATFEKDYTLIEKSGSSS